MDPSNEHGSPRSSCGICVVCELRCTANLWSRGRKVQACARTGASAALRMNTCEHQGIPPPSGPDLLFPRTWPCWHIPGTWVCWAPSLPLSSGHLADLASGRGGDCSAAMACAMRSEDCTEPQCPHPPHRAAATSRDPPSSLPGQVQAAGWQRLQGGEGWNQPHAHS